MAKDREQLLASVWQSEGVCAPSLRVLVDCLSRRPEHWQKKTRVPFSSVVWGTIVLLVNSEIPGEDDSEPSILKE